MEIKNTIKNLGLSEQETEIYLTLLKMGDLPASRIAKIVGLKRTTVYPVLQNLSIKSYIRVVYKNNLRYYQASSPQSIVSYMEKKINDFNSIIPILQSFEKSQAQSIGLRFIETKEELRNFYIDIINEYENRSYLVIGDTTAWQSVDVEFFRHQFPRERANANIKTKLLLTHNSKKLIPSDKTLLRTYKFLPKKYIFKSTIDVFDDKILIVSPEINALALVIAIPAMTDIFRSIFEFMWEHNK